MSFILDALRKSENERQQATIPGISNVPAVVHRTRMPRWTMGVIAGLATCLVLLSWAWLRDVGPSDGSVTAFTAPPSTPLQPTTRSDADAIRSLAREARQPALNATVGTPSAPGQSSGGSAPSTPAAAATPIVSMADFQASGGGLPELNLELHVFSPSPAERFVFINSTKYREGEPMREGPRLRSITEGGVILEYQGQSLLLPRE